MKIIKKKLTDEQILARRRNSKILEANITDSEMEIRDIEYMLENKVSEIRLRGKLAIEKSKKENAEQNLKIITRELRTGQVEMDESQMLNQNPMQVPQNGQ